MTVGELIEALRGIVDSGEAAADAEVHVTTLAESLNPDATVVHVDTDGAGAVLLAVE